MDKLVCFVMISSVVPLFHLAEAKITPGFSIELIHRDSPLSPLYNHSIPPSEVLRNAAHRSISRLNHLYQFSLNENDIVSIISPDHGSHVMRLSIGTPPVKIIATADTGSDLTWIQCHPCIGCYPQKDPIFNPPKSSTYRLLPCDSQPCKALPTHSCGDKNECHYHYAYLDEVSSEGDLATDTFTFQSTNGQAVPFPASVFGCGHNNTGNFSQYASGVVGLGKGTLSLISQLGDHIQHKFSYCLLPYSSRYTSKLRFGNDAIIYEKPVVSTPIVLKYPATYYYLTLNSIKVGEETAFFYGEGNIILDSGATLTHLEQRFYNNLEGIVKRATRLKEAPVPKGSKYALCYKSAFGVGLPDMTFRFKGGDILLKSSNTFLKVGDSVFCLAIIPSQSLSIYGNLAQVNFQVKYDLAGRMVQFAPADCKNY